MHFDIYGKDNCTFCKGAIALLTGRNIPFKYFTLGEHFTREELLEKFPDAKTFPQICTETGRVVGGYTDLQSYLKVNDNTTQLNKSGD